MKKIIPAIICIFLSTPCWAQNVNFEWVAHFGEIYWEKGKSVTIDLSGNVYSAGYFSGTIDFDPGPGVYTLSAINNTYGFISKLDANRNLIWAKVIEGLDAHPLSIQISSNGDLIILGSYVSVIDLDPGPGVVNGSTSDKLFLIKLDASGDFVWGKTFASNSFVFNKPFNLALDRLGNCYVTGTYGNFTDLDPGPGIFTLPNVSGSEDIFILKLDLNGDFVWAKGIGSQSTFDEGNAIAVDGAGNVFITGTFAGACDFDPGPGTFIITEPYWSAYILKLNTSGDFVWAKHLKSTNYQSNGFSIKADQTGNVFIGGTFYGEVDFDPGPAELMLGSVGYVDFFICKLDAAGNLIWAKTTGSTADDMLNALEVDAAGNVYATGSFYLTVDFDPGPGSFNITTAPGQKEAFIFKWDAQGDFVWAKAIGGLENDYGTSLAVDGGGSVYTIGAFETVADFDPGPGIENLTSLGYDDIFLLKLSKCANNTFSFITASECSSYTLNNQAYNSSGIYTQTIPNTVGCDSIITLNLTINRKFTTTDTTICEGQSYYAGSAYQTTSGIYKDTLLTSLSCDSIVTTTLTVHQKPKPNLGPDGNICLDVPTKITPGVFNSYLWQDNSTQPDFLINVTGQYWVKVTDANNCSATDTLNVMAIDTVPKNFLPPNQQMCYGNNLRIEVPGYIDYTWNDGSKAQYFNISSFGTFYLTVRDFNNCVGTDSITIQRANCIPIGIPNAFTPNNDGLNDIFKPTINQAIQKFSFIVFNRYGEKVFETREYGKGWDGTYKGKEQPAGSYVYRILFTNINGWESENNGSVLLIR